MTKQLVLLAFISALFINTNGQIPTGTWREHLPYNQGKYVAVNNNIIYCATKYALFYYNKTDNTINRKSKILGLSDLGIGHIAFNKQNNKLIIGYNNGNIDIIEDDIRRNFPDIKDKNIMTDKAIYHINTNGNFAYLSTGFGIVVFNLAKNEITDTYIIGQAGTYKKINASAIFNNNIYALTDNGIWQGELNNPFLNNYNNWQKITSVPFDTCKFYLAVTTKNYLVVCNSFTDTTLCTLSTFDGQNWKRFLGDTLHNIKSLRYTNNKLVVVPYVNAYSVYNEQLQLEKTRGAYYINDVDIDNQGNHWIASDDVSLVAYGDNYFANPKPEGPQGETAFEMQNINNVMIVAPGNYNRLGISSYLHANVYSFENEQWNHLRTNNRVNTELYKIRDVVCIAPYNSKHYFAGSWGYGIFEVNDNIVTQVYNQATNPDMFDKYPFVSSMAIDKNGNLWSLHRRSEKPIKVKTTDNKWYSLNYGSNFIQKETGKLLYTQNGDFWAISNHDDGILVWNDNNTPENESDDQYKYFFASNEKNERFNTNYHSIAQDHNGSIWIGTEDGVIIYDYPQNVLSNQAFYARQPQLIVDNYYKTLLENKKVTSIAIDGANRKWLGTDGAGLFLVSADGSEELISFTENSSKLFSNTIKSLAFNAINGELFIGTDKGIQSYMTTASEPREGFTGVYAFPNPVRPGYNGFITIRGLMYNTNIKITDLSGNLVYETTSNGGDAVWNGYDMQNRKVSSGIYTVLCNNPDGTQTETTKILFIK